MAHFRGVVQGQRGEASRLGSQRLKTVAQAWGGEVRVTLWRETLGDTPGDYVRISVCANSATYGDTAGPERTLYYGPLAALRAAGIQQFPSLTKGE
jgi:hypothetical protein